MAYSDEDLLWIYDRTSGYFFHGKDITVLAHGLTKEDKVPDTEIDGAVKRKQALERNPEAHITMEDDHG